MSRWSSLETSPSIAAAGVPVITADYEFRTKLVGNVSLVVDFSASSDPNAAPVQVE